MDPNFVGGVTSDGTAQAQAPCPTCGRCPTCGQYRYTWPTGPYTPVPWPNSLNPYQPTIICSNEKV